MPVSLLCEQKHMVRLLGCMKYQDSLTRTQTLLHFFNIAERWKNHSNRLAPHSHFQKIVVLQFAILGEFG